MAPAREKLITLLKESLEPLPYVYAAWLEGADALGTVDLYSDIDLWLDVEDGYETKVINDVREGLGSTGPLELDYERNHPHPKIRQCFFRLRGASKFCFVDLCIQSHSRALPFLQGHDTIKILFDKKEVVSFQTPPENDAVDLIQTLSAEFNIYQLWVDKALIRKQFLEALAAYQTYTLSPLVKLLRQRYAPLKIDYGLKHCYKDLPECVTARLEPLYKVASLAELTQVHEQAKTWFYEETAKLR